MWKRSAIGAALAGLIAFTAACGGNAADPAVKETIIRDEAPPPAKKVPVELVFKDETFSWTAEDFMSDYGNAIEEQFPHVKVTFVPRKPSIQQMLQSGDKLDVVITSILSFYQNIINNNIQYDLTPLIKRYHYDLNRIESNTVALAKQIADGGIFGLPINGGATPIIYNKDLFDQFNVPYPKDEMTWDDFVELTRKLTRTEGGKQYRGSLVASSFLFLRNPFSLGLINPSSGTADLTSPKWKLLLNEYLKVYQVPGNQFERNQYSGQPAKDLFVKDKLLAMWAPISGTGLRELTFEGMNYDFVQFPKFKEAPGIGPQPYPLYFYLSQSSQNKEQTFEVLAYLTSDEFQMEKSKKGILTVLKNKDIQRAFAQDSPDLRGKNIRAMVPGNFAPPPYRSKYDNIAAMTLQQEIASAVLGMKDLDTAVRDAEQAINKSIKAAKAVADTH